jgi:hypothetical protein
MQRILVGSIAPRACVFGRMSAGEPPPLSHRRTKSQFERW